jgi:hypothetical protein
MFSSSAFSLKNIAKVRYKERKIRYHGVQNKKSSESENEKEKKTQHLKQGPRGYRL